MVRDIAMLFMGTLAACASVAPSTRRPAQDLADSLIRQVNVVIGARELDDPAWGKLDEPSSIGLDFTQGYGSRWLFLEGGFHYASDEASMTDTSGDPIRADLDFFEFSAGVLAQWPRDGSWVRPYLGAGAVMVLADADIENNGEPGDDDTVFGAYWKVGVLVSVSLQSHFGVELRAVDGRTVSTELADAEIDSTQLSLVFGASF